MKQKRLFQVIVLGGVALVNCGGEIVPQRDASLATDASSDALDEVGFPSELPVFVDARPAPPEDASTSLDGDAGWFPSEVN